MSNVYVVESVSDCDGGYLPDTRRIQAIFSSEEDADMWVNKNKSDYNEYEVNGWELDTECVKQVVEEGQ